MSADAPPDSHDGDAHSSSVEVSVQNIGGIDEAAVAFQPGVTVLTGPNATNRTSLLNAIRGALGGAAPTVKSDTDVGTVRLVTDETEVDLTISDAESGVRVEGVPYTDDRILVEQFVSLLEDNPLRRAVAADGDLYDLLMAPVDTDHIEQQIADHRSELARLEERIESAEQAERRLPTLEQRQAELTDRREEIVAEIAEIQEEIDEYEASKEAVEEAEQLVEQVETQRTAAEAAADRVADREAELTRLRDELDEVEAELESLDVPQEQLESVEAELEERTAERRAAEQRAADLQRIVEFNQDVLEDEFDQVATGDDSPVDALDPESREVECWTCGSTVERSDIRRRLQTLEAVVEDRRETVRDLEARIDELESTRDDLRRRAERRDDLERRRERLQRKIAAQEESLSEARDEYEATQAEVERIETQIAETESLRDTDLLALHQELSDLEYERGQVDRDLEDLQAEVDRADTLAAERDQLVDQRDELREEIATLRSHVDDLERTAVEAINERMADFVGKLEYENIERVWVERLTTADGETESFDLHIVRTDEDGVAYEDTVETLSESERELVGLVLALAGYLVHDVAETVPFMLLDSLEAIDADRIAALIDYFETEVPYLVVALLPEDAERLPDHYRGVESSEF